MRCDTTPREFCREPGYDKAVLLTYNFDALFFERIVLPDLWIGGSTDVQVIADLGQITEALPRWIGQVRQLGQRYQLTSANARGAFHPKILLRAGPTGAALWIGSGNTTHGGWGCNLEVGTAWCIGPESPDHGGWLRPLLSHIAKWLPSSMENTAFSRILNAAWLAGGDNFLLNAPVLVSQTQRPIAEQLMDRWRGRRFDQVIIVTGSTDKRGSVLEWFNNQFGVSRATVLLDGLRYICIAPPLSRNLARAPPLTVTSQPRNKLLPVQPSRP